MAAETEASRTTSALEDAHEDALGSDGRREVKYAFAFKKNDWESYHEFRPVYPPSMWRTWMKYHKEHGSGCQDAHDLASGS